MPQPVVCLLDPYPPTGPYDRERDKFAERGIELRLADCQRPDDVAEQGRGAEVLLTMAVAVTGAALEALPDCRLVVRWGVGYDSIDVAAATRLGIAVGNCPTYCTEEVADHAAALILAGVRILHRQRRGLALHPARCVDDVAHGHVRRPQGGRRQGKTRINPGGLHGRVAIEHGGADEVGP